MYTWTLYTFIFPMTIVISVDPGFRPQDNFPPWGKQKNCPIRITLQDCTCVFGRPCGASLKDLIVLGLKISQVQLCSEATHGLLKNKMSSDVGVKTLTLANQQWAPDCLSFFYHFNFAFYVSVLWTQIQFYTIFILFFIFLTIIFTWYDNWLFMI